MCSIRYDWYQTEDKVVVTVMLKNAKEKDYKVQIENERLHMSAKDFELNLTLYAGVDADKSSYRDFPSKVEITLIKLIGIRWESLEKSKDTSMVSVTKAPPPIHKKNWDNLAKEIDKATEEEAQNEEALTQLFQKIYKTSSPEVQWAMKKSFYESNGTVLSTNWKEVSKDKVEVKPPDGVEFHKWNE